MIGRMLKTFVNAHTVAVTLVMKSLSDESIGTNYFISIFDDIM